MRSSSTGKADPISGANSHFTRHAVKGERRDQSARDGRRFARIRPRAQSFSPSRDKGVPDRKVRSMMDRGFRGSTMVSNTIYGVGSSPSLRGGRTDAHE
jgi:hypothetical protein